MLNHRWLMRMSQWARNPPSWQRVVFVLSIIAACLAAGLYEYFYGWPDALTVQGGNKLRHPKF
jgi:hypothetical protein